MTKQIIWTQDLADAVKAVSVESAPHPYGHDNTDADVRGRCREFVRFMQVGAEMTRQNVEYFNCLYQRLDSGRDARASHVALVAAWRAA